MMLTEKLRILYKNLQIIHSQFFTDRLILFYIRYNSKIYLFMVFSFE
jgi:hypothetical protein